MYLYIIIYLFYYYQKVFIFYYNLLQYSSDTFLEFISFGKNNLNSGSNLDITKNNNTSDLLSQLNEEKEKNKKITEQLENANKIIKELTNDLNNEKINNKKLNEELIKEKDKAKQLFNDWNKEKQANTNFINMNNILNDKIKSLQNELDAKISELENLKNNNNNNSDINVIRPGEKIMVAHFISCDQKINRAIACKNTDSFVRIEEKLYEEYPEYKEFHTYFTVGGIMIYRFKSMQDNKIKDGEKIMLCYDE